MKKYLIKYGAAVIIAAAMVGLTVSLRDTAAMTDLEKFKLWADAFTIPGVIYLMVGVIVWVSTTGFFDMLSYGLVRAGRMLVPFSNIKRNDETFYDYKMKKSSERFTGYAFIFIVGAAFLAVGILFTVLFFTA